MALEDDVDAAGTTLSVGAQGEGHGVSHGGGYTALHKIVDMDENAPPAVIDKPVTLGGVPHGDFALAEG
jgi:hypothetical protein